MPDMRTRLSASGLTLFIAALSCLAVGVGLLNPILTQGSLFAVMLVVIAIPLSRLNFRRLDCHIVVPEVVFCNDDIDVEIQLNKTGALLPAFDIAVHCSILPVNEHLLFSYVPAGTKARRSTVARFAQRRIYTNCQYRLRSTFPWGLVVIEQAGTARLNLSVCPAPSINHDLAAILEQGAGLSGSRYTRSDDLLGRFSAMREFRPGDRIKLISWPFSARHDTLMVKEMELPSLSQCHIVFHSYQPRHTLLTKQSFEVALSTLAGLFTFFHDQLIPFRFIDCSVTDSTITVLPDSASIHQALTVLASANMQPHSDMSAINTIIDDAAVQGATLIIVSNAPLRLWKAHLSPGHTTRICMDNNRFHVLSGDSA